MSWRGEDSAWEPTQNVVACHVYVGACGCMWVRVQIVGHEQTFLGVLQKEPFEEEHEHIRIRVIHITGSLGDDHVIIAIPRSPRQMFPADD